MRYIRLIITLIIGLAMDMAAEGITADSIFIQNSRPIKFVVNRINISDQDREWITDVLIPELQRLIDLIHKYQRAYDQEGYIEVQQNNQL